MEYKKSERWRLEGKQFNLEVKHWSKKDTNKWNIYLFLFPKFPRFEEFKEGLLTWLPIEFNWGNTYCSWNRDKNREITCKIYGSDYQHIHQERFEKYSTRAEAYEVFNDAEEYFKILKDWEKELKH